MRTIRFAPSPLMTKLLIYPSSLRMRAISSFNFDAGTSTRECLAETAFRIRANMSAIGSVMLYSVKRFQIFDCRFAIEGSPRWAFQIANLKSKIANYLYQLDFTTPGICPCKANSRKQIRHR